MLKFFREAQLYYKNFSTKTESNVSVSLIKSSKTIYDDVDQYVLSLATSTL